MSPKGGGNVSGKGCGKAPGKGAGGKGFGGKSFGGKAPKAFNGGMDAKPYSAALRGLFESTAVRPSDVDIRALKLLDALEAAGKAPAAIAHLAKSLEGVAREKVVTWKAYIFTLLRAFDRDVYKAMKEGTGRPRPRQDGKEAPLVIKDAAVVHKDVPVVLTPLKVGAPEFVPGQPWFGRNIVEVMAQAVPMRPPVLPPVAAAAPSPAPAPAPEAPVEPTPEAAAAAAPAASAPAEAEALTPAPTPAATAEGAPAAEAPAAAPVPEPTPEPAAAPEAPVPAPTSAATAEGAPPAQAAAPAPVPEPTPDPAAAPEAPNDTGPVQQTEGAPSPTAAISEPADGVAGPGNVVFQVVCETSPGEVAAVVGGCPELGAWSTPDARRLSCGNTYPLWKSDPVPVNVAQLEYKFLVVNETTKSVRWEPLPGNRMYKPGAPIEVAKFGEP